MNTDNAKNVPTHDEEALNQQRSKLLAAHLRSHNVLGCGFAKKVYENAFIHESKKRGLNVMQQFKVSVMYDGVLVGKYIADAVVEGSVLLEIKAVTKFDDAHCSMFELSRSHSTPDLSTYQFRQAGGG